MRLCKLRRWPDYTGYGFNLHVYSGGGCGQSPSVPDQYVIGTVESGSPAEAGGLRRGDRLIAVNGQQIVVIEDDVSKTGGQGHGRSTLDAVAMIKVRPDRVNLLVVDPEAQAYFTDRGLPLDGQQPYIEVITTPEKGQGK
jgi:C-terminal processing protease CtpA/Prc